MVRLGILAPFFVLMLFSAPLLSEDKARIVFRGNRSFPNQLLLEKIGSFTFENSEEETLKALRKRLKYFYKEQGFFHAGVKTYLAKATHHWQKRGYSHLLTVDVVENAHLS